MPPYAKPGTPLLEVVRAGQVYGRFEDAPSIEDYFAALRARDERRGVSSVGRDRRHTVGGFTTSAGRLQVTAGKRRTRIDWD